LRGGVNCPEARPEIVENKKARIVLGTKTGAILEDEKRAEFNSE
jgi:hypothetical protein